MRRYAITDRTLSSGDEQTRREKLVEQAARLASEGVDFLQLREKDMEAGALAELARQLLGALRAGGVGTKLLINSRADVALAVGADGVHLASAPGSLAPAQVRQLYAGAGRAAPVVSVSCHTLEDVVAARGAADLILFGPVFEKQVGGRKVAEGSGLELLRSACVAAASTPVLALGGVTPEEAEACLAAGAAGIAAIRLFSS